MSVATLEKHESLTDPTTALHLSQKAPDILRRPAPSSKIFPLSLIAASESPETWANYEQLLLSCLRTGDDPSAHLCLERLSARFGTSNERVMGLRGLYQEAVAKNNSDLDEILKGYNKILRENPVNVPILKRRVAILRSMERSSEAITVLVDYLESSPTDAEAWVELAELYQIQGLFSQTIFSLEEALLITPNAWNLHARLGEIDCMAAMAATDGSENSQRLLTDAIQRFSRSVELCDDYLRGIYGLKVACEKLQSSLKAASKPSADVLPEEVLVRLDKMATERLSRIVKGWPQSAGSPRYNEREIIAAKELVGRSRP